MREENDSESKREMKLLSFFTWLSKAGRPVKWAVFGSVFAVYWICFPWALQWLGPPYRALALTYIVIAALSLGIKGGVAVTVGCAFAGFVLLKAYGIAYIGNMVSPIIGLSVAAIVGGFVDLCRNLEDQIVRREKAERELLNYRDHLEELVELRTSELAEANRNLQMEMSQRAEAEERRRQLEKKLSQSEKLEALGTMAGGFAHSFNDILAVILGYTEIALDDTERKSVVWQSLKQIFAAGNRAKNLVRQILDFSNPSAEGRKPVRLAPLIRETLAFLRPSVPASIEIRERLSGENDIVMADPLQIRQALMKLCSNAAETLGERGGGTLEIALDRIVIKEQEREPFSSLKPGSYLRLTVSDTGLGIEPDALDRIFDPFFSTRKKAKKAGLGLAAVYGVVKGHGGEIAVESEAGKGSTFHVCFPVLKSYADMDECPPPDRMLGDGRVS